MAGKENKNKKYGRNAVKCKVYATQGRREKNKKRRLLTLLVKQPHNEQLQVALDKLNVSEQVINEHIERGIFKIIEKLDRKLVSLGG